MKKIQTKKTTIFFDIISRNIADNFFTVRKCHPSPFGIIIKIVFHALSYLSKRRKTVFCFLFFIQLGESIYDPPQVGLILFQS